MLTGMLAVRNLCGERHDLWEVNTDRSYPEEWMVPAGHTSTTTASAETRRHPMVGSQRHL